MTDHNRDVLNDLFNIGAGCDLITPTWAILQDMAKGPVARFGILANAGFDRGDIRRRLSQNGVESWGYVYNTAGDLIMISVPQAQAGRASYFLEQGGVPVLYSPNETARPSVVLSNDLRMAPMTIVKAPSVWALMGRLIARMGL